EAASIGLDHDRSPVAADAGIDDGEKDRRRRELDGVDREQIGRAARIEGRRIGEEIDDRNARRLAMENRLHLSDIGPFEPEVGEQHDHPASVALSPSTSAVSALSPSALIARLGSPSETRASPARAGPWRTGTVRPAAVITAWASSLIE